MTARPSGGGTPARAKQGKRCIRGAFVGVLSSYAERFVPRHAGTFLLSFAGIFMANAAYADDAEELELAKNRFDAGQYEEAIQRFASMLDPARPACEKGPTNSDCRITDPDLIERARTLYTASLIALHRPAEAEAQIELVLRNNPNFSPNPAVFPQEVIDRFTEVRGRLRAELEDAARKRAEEARKARLIMQKAQEDERRWIQQLERLAGQERIVVKNSRLVAALPFGVGQFQNGDRGLGWFFAISQGLTSLSSIISAQVMLSDAAAPRKTADGRTVDRIALNPRISTAVLINQISFGAWATLAAAGIVQAQLAFVPERVTLQDRPVPKRPSSMAGVSITFWGTGIGVAGHF